MSERRRAEAPYDRVLSEVHLPWAVALWVLTAHAITLFSPFYLSWVLREHWDAIAARSYDVQGYQAAIAIFFAASAFEIAQNTVDKWYLTPDTGSAWGVGFCDFMFWALLVMGMGALAYAATGFSWWLAMAVVGMAIYPFVYLLGGIYYPSLAISGLGACIALFLRFEDPMVFFLAISPSAFLMYCFTAMLRTGNQVLHGFTTLSSAVGFCAATWAIESAVTGNAHAWREFGITLAVIVAAGLALRPWVVRLPATRRVVRGRPSASSSDPAQRADAVAKSLVMSRGA